MPTDPVQQHQPPRQEGTNHSILFLGWPTRAHSNLSTTEGTQLQGLVVVAVTFLAYSVRTHHNKRTNTMETMVSTGSTRSGHYVVVTEDGHTFRIGPFKTATAACTRAAAECQRIELPRAYVGAPNRL